MPGYIVEVFSVGYVTSSSDGALTFINEKARAGVFGHAREAVDTLNRAGWDTDSFRVIPYAEPEESALPPAAVSPEETRPMPAT